MGCDQVSLVGQYLSGQYVIVHGEQQREELRLLGCFGRDLESIMRKEDTRRGPEDRRALDILTKTRLTTTADETTLTILALHEAYYLNYCLGCLHLVTADEKPIDLDVSWNLFRKYHQTSNIKLDFAIEFGVYHFFRSRGWVVKAGDNYGTNFLLYKEGPSVDHSHYAVHIVRANDHTGPTWQSLLTYHRVIQSVSKELLLVSIEKPDSLELDKPSVIKNMKLNIRKLKNISNLML